MLRSLVTRRYLPFWGCALLVITLAAIDQRWSAASRLSAIDLVHADFPDTYLMRSKTRKGFGYLVDRRASTIRRSRENFGGPAWSIERFDYPNADGRQPSWLARSRPRGTVLLLPAEAVRDRDLPFDYAFVRREYPALELPDVQWTQLFLDRLYQGLYLRVDLPVDLRKRDGGSGVRRELLGVDDDRMVLVDTRFDPDALLYRDCIAVGAFPQVVPPDPILQWLDSRRPEGPTTFLLSATEPHRVSLLPFPVPIGPLIGEVFGETAPAWVDERFRRWTAASRFDGASAPFDAARVVRHREELADYHARLAHALRIDAALQPFNRGS